MSLRPADEVPPPQHMPFTTAAAASSPSLVFYGDSAPTQAAAEATALSWRDLSETEKSAASLGVDPSSYRPIAFLNDAFHTSLLTGNLIDGELAKKLEAYKLVSAGVHAP